MDGKIRSFYLSDVFTHAPIPLSPQNTGKPSPTLPAQSPRSRSSGRDSRRDARKCGNRDSHEAM